MRALKSFTVRPELPEALALLEPLALNLRWAWDDRTRDLFRWVDPEAWDATRHDPVGLLGTVSPERLRDLAQDQAFLRFLHDVHNDFTRYLDAPRVPPAAHDIPGCIHPGSSASSKPRLAPSHRR